MNFGNPQRPEIMGQFALSIEGMADACRALDYPVISGNVSLYNETNGKGILPTPTIGGVGVLKNIDSMATVAFKAAGQVVLVVGESKGWLGQSIYLRETQGREEGAPPPVDLKAERRNGDFLRGLIVAGDITTCHDVADGGLLVAVAEMAMAGQVGVTLTTPQTDVPSHGYWFGEDQARYVIAVPSAAAAGVEAKAKAAGVPIEKIGETGGDAVVLDGRKMMIQDLKQSHEAFLPTLMGAA
jgi:phosphoribosylformylglycinamidine synthase